MIDCACRKGPELCDECRASLFAQLRGVAARRGEVWAGKLPRRPHTAAELDVIVWCVDDIASDPKLRAQLAAVARVAPKQ